MVGRVPRQKGSDPRAYGGNTRTRRLERESNTHAARPSVTIAVGRPPTTTRFPAASPVAPSSGRTAPSPRARVRVVTQTPPLPAAIVPPGTEVIVVVPRTRSVDGLMRRTRP